MTIGLAADVKTSDDRRGSRLRGRPLNFIRQGAPLCTTQLTTRDCCTGEGGAVPLDHVDNVVGSGKGEVPQDAAVPVGGDPRVDSGGSLAAVDDGSADGGPGLLDSADGTAEDSEREVLFEEGAEESTVLKLLADVGVHILGCHAGGGQIGGGVAWIRGGHERDVPAEGEVLEQLRAVEVVLESMGPSLKVEGLVWEGDPEAVHVGRSSGQTLSGEDPPDVLVVD